MSQGSIISKSSVGTFKSLLDTPNTYSGASGFLVKVNNSETGLEFSSEIGASNFSYDYIESPITIPIYQQMLVHQSIHVDSVLTINGKLVLIG